MSGAGFACILVLYLVNFSHVFCQITEIMGKSRDMCMRIAKDPYFDIDIVVGKPWRIYYTWNMNLDTRCLDMVFRNATPQVRA